MKSRRNGKGVTLAVVAIFALLLAILIYGLTQLSMFLGGGREMRNAVDAGTLNVGKKVLTNDSLKIALQSFGAQSRFADIADQGGKISLGNVNRMWGEVLLMEANAVGAGGDAKANADSMFDAAKQISSQLAGKINNENNLYGFFEEISKQNSLRMLGDKTEAVPYQGAQGWLTSLLDRGAESNLEVTTAEIMPGNTGNSVPMTDKFISGYNPFTVNGKTFSFVPFKQNERTHLVSGVDFNANTHQANPLQADWGTPVPNSLSARGRSKDHKMYGQEGIAYVISNPQQTYKLSIPHSFVHLKLEENEANWNFLGTPPTFSQSEYGYRPELQDRVGRGILCTLNVSNFELGTEFIPPTLDSAIFGYPFAADKAKIENTLLNRLNQMISKPGKKITAGQLHGLLNSLETAGWLEAGKRDFYLFCADGENIDVQPKEIALVKAPWLSQFVEPVIKIDNAADGAESKLADRSLPGPPVIPYVQISMTPDFACVPVPPPIGWSFINGEMHWRPGSGYSGCLGEIRVKRETDIYLEGVCTPII